MVLRLFGIGIKSYTVQSSFSETPLSAQRTMAKHALLESGVHEVRQSSNGTHFLLLPNGIAEFWRGRPRLHLALRGRAYMPVFSLIGITNCFLSRSSYIYII